MDFDSEIVYKKKGYENLEDMVYRLNVRKSRLLNMGEYDNLIDRRSTVKTLSPYCVKQNTLVYFFTKKQVEIIEKIIKKRDLSLNTNWKKELSFRYDNFFNGCIEDLLCNTESLEELFNSTEETISPTQFYILWNMVYMNENHNLNARYDTYMERLGVSRERVAQISKDTFRKLRHPSRLIAELAHNGVLMDIAESDYIYYSDSEALENDLTVMGSLDDFLPLEKEKISKSEIKKRDIFPNVNCVSGDPHSL